MSVTIRDIMKLPCMRGAEIVAGKGGLDNVVTAVTVLEYCSFSEDQDKLFYEQNYEGSDIVITAFSCVKDDQGTILSEMMSSKAVGEAGVIIYYFDLFVKKLDQSVLDFADEVGYPIIIMPRDQYQLRYSEAISEISELIIADRSQAENFGSSIMETLVSLPKNQQNITTLLRLLSNYLHVTLIMTGSDWKLTAFAGWPKILEREIEDVLQKILEEKFNEPYDVIKFEDIPGRKVNLIVTGREPLKKAVLEQITDVVRLYLKMTMNEPLEAAGSEQLIRAIIGDEPVKMRKLAKNMGIDASKLRNMIIYREPHLNLPSGTVILREIRDMFSRYCHDHVEDMYSGDVVSFLDDGISSQWLPILRSLNESMISKGMEPLCVYARNLADPSDVRDAYLSVTEHLDDARSLYANSSILSFHEVMFVAELKNIISQGEDRIRRELEPLKYLGDEKDEQTEELIRTLSSFYFDSGQSVSRTADNLFIHVNTVKYRLKKISEIIGCKVTEMPEMMELYKALALYRLIRS